AFFQVVLDVTEKGDSTLRLPGVECLDQPVEFPVVRFDMWLGLTELKGPDGECRGVVGELLYSTDLFDRATMQNLVEKFLALLRAAAAEPELRLTSMNSPRKLRAVQRKPVKLQPTT
ncbi:hypothetical protein ACF1FY_34005, partial [Streptomyces althioticus]